MKTAMTDEEKRIAIAEYCGWKRWQDQESGILGGDWSKWIWTPPSDHTLGAAKSEPPDFLNSLDAMHAAEEVLFAADQPFMSSPQPFDIYEHHLSMEVLGHSQWGNGSWTGRPRDAVRIAHATARQRAEAFMKTIQQP